MLSSWVSLLYCLWLHPIVIDSYRLVAVGHRQSVNASTSYGTWFEQFNRTDLYQLRSEEPMLVAFGELTGLTAAFIGTRGRTVRSQSGTIQDALFSLIQPYERQISFYMNKYSGISARNALELSLSDVMWRAFNETFSALARSLKATIVTGTLGPRIVRSINPADIEFFGDPDLQPRQTEVYLPESSEVYNTAHVYAPNGNLIASRDKSYLTSEEIDLLQLTPGKLEDNRVIAPDNLCIAICLDAFYSNMLAYLDSQNCSVLIQPSFNMRMWAANVSDTSPLWQPLDWTHAPMGLFDKTQRIRYSINPMVTGNLFSDVVVDGQSSINERRSMPMQDDDLYVGLDSSDLQTMRHFHTLALSRWARDDPRQANLTKSDRRQLLHQFALELAPQSKSPNENKYADTVIWADVGSF